MQVNNTSLDLSPNPSPTKHFGESRPLLNVEIAKVLADPFLSINGEPLIAKKSKERLVLDNGEQTRISIAMAKNSEKLYDFLFGKLSNSRYTVKAQIGDDSYTLNIKSLCSRLHLSKYEIKDALRNGTLDSLILAKAKDLNDMLSECARLKKDGPDHLKNLSEDNLLKLVNKAWESRKGEYSYGSYIELRVGNNEKKNFLLTRDIGRPHIYAFPIDENGQVNLGDKILGKGAYGTVYEILKLTGKDFASVAKMANLQQSGARVDILNEVKIVYKIHSTYNRTRDKIPLAVMPRPRAVFNYTGGINLCGYLTEPFDYNGEKYIKEVKPSAEELDKQFTNLERSLEFLHKSKFFHGDIKLSNLSYKKGENTLKFIDFGGALDASQFGKYTLENLVRDSKDLLSYTPCYCFDKVSSLIHKQASLGNDTKYLTLLGIRDKIALKLAYLEALCGASSFWQFFSFVEKSKKKTGEIKSIKTNTDQIIKMTVDDSKQAKAKELVNDLANLVKEAESLDA